MVRTAVIDRIEGNVAVVEIDGGTLDVPLAGLPAGVAEGCRLVLDGETWALAPADPGDSAEARQQADGAEARLARLKARTPQSGDIDI